MTGIYGRRYRQQYNVTKLRFHKKTMSCRYNIYMTLTLYCCRYNTIWLDGDEERVHDHRVYINVRESVLYDSLIYIHMYMRTSS